MTTPHNPTLQAALAYLEKGWRIVPIPRGVKGPVIKGWQNLRLTHAELVDRLRDESNIGIILGEPSGWIVDVDLDSDQAISLASEYLPPTVVTGRGNNAASHYWYVCEGAKTTKFQNESGMIVEIRSTGAQTVVGPSVHPSGDTYDVLHGEPTKIGFDELLSAVSELAKACGWVEHKPLKPAANWITQTRPIVQHHARESYGLEALKRECDVVASAMEGYRNDTLNRAAFRMGQLIAGGELDQDLAVEYLLQAANACGLARSESEATIRSGLAGGARAPRQRQERHGEVVAVDLSGWGAGDADTGQNSEHCPPQDELEDSDAAPNEPDIDRPPFPTELLSVPGLIGEMVAHNLATAYRPQPILALAAAIALQAGLAARKIEDAHGNRTNVYIISLARTGAGKEHGRSLNTEILHEAGMDHVDGPGEWASDAGLVSSVAKNPGIMFQVDELGNHLRTMRSDFQDAHKMGIVTNLLKFYSCANSVFKGKAYADADKNVVIDRPCVVIHGTSTLETFWPGLTSHDLHTGLVGRLCIFTAPDRPAKQRRESLSIPTKLIEMVKWWGLQGRTMGGAMSGEACAVPITDGAMAEFVALSDEADEIMSRGEKGNEEGGESNATVWGRAEEKARRLALVYACSKFGGGFGDMNACQVDEECAKWACSLVRYQTRAMLSEADAWVADSQFDARQKRVLRAIEKAKGKGMGRRQLWNSMRSLSPRERDEVMKNLIETNQIVETRSREGAHGKVGSRFFTTRWAPTNAPHP